MFAHARIVCAQKTCFLKVNFTFFAVILAYFQHCTGCDRKAVTRRLKLRPPPRVFAPLRVILAYFQHCTGCDHFTVTRRLKLRGPPSSGAPGPGPNSPVRGTSSGSMCSAKYSSPPGFPPLNMANLCSYRLSASQRPTQPWWNPPIESTVVGRYYRPARLPRAKSTPFFPITPKPENNRSTISRRVATQRVVSLQIVYFR